MTSRPAISPPSPADAPAIIALLREAGLPHEDIAPHLAHFLVARDVSGAIIGVIGAEVCAPDALLRSLTVAKSHRRVGLGRALLAAVEQAAGPWGVAQWWLLTTTARSFFESQGFLPVSRTAAPPAILATGQFQGLCPSVAACWSRERRAP
jgi:amino-acid N-acetyltransferase